MQQIRCLEIECYAGVPWLIFRPGDSYVSQTGVTPTPYVSRTGVTRDLLNGWQLGIGLATRSCS